MDAKITKGRLGHLLSYDWLKMAGLCAIAVVLCLVLFTTIAARASAGQIFEIFTYAGVYTDEEELGDLDKLKSRGALSYEVLDMSSTLITADTGSLLFSVRFAAGEGDVVVTVDGGGTQDENGNYTALEGLKDFLYGYRGGCYSLSLDGKDYSDEQGVSSRNYFTRCEQYLGTYFRNAAGEVDWRGGTLDESALREHFFERIKGDRRYKSDKQREAAFEQEIGRLNDLRTAYVAVKDELTKENGVIAVKTVSFNYNGVQYDLPYAIDLSGMDNIAEVFASSSGESTRDGLSLCLLNTDNNGVEDLQFEGVTFLYYLMEHYA